MISAPDTEAEHGGSLPVLVVMAGLYRCALPLAQTVETMRPLRVLPLSGLPPFIRGMAIIRGEPVPVVDLAWFFGGESGEIHRFVVVRVEQRRVALAVESVIGVKDLPQTELRAVPELLKKVHPESLQALSCSDQSLLLVLGSARIVPDEIWGQLTTKHVQLD